jgi:hypothetical protein
MRRTLEKRHVQGETQAGRYMAGREIEEGARLGKEKISSIVVRPLEAVNGREEKAIYWLERRGKGRD